MCLVINFSLDCVERVATFEWQTEKCYLLLETRHLFFFFKSSFFCWFSGNGCNTAAGGIGLKTADKLKLNLRWFRCGSDLLKFFFLYYDKTSQRFSPLLFGSFLLRTGRRRLFAVVSRADHHRGPFESIVPSAPAEPNDTCDEEKHETLKNNLHLSFFLFFFVFSVFVGMYNTLSGCKILWVGQVDAVESSSARFPPPAALEHGGAVEAGSVVVPFESDLHFAVISLLRFTTDAHKQKKKKARRKLFFFFLTDCTWRRDSSWSRTRDRSASLRRCPCSRQSPACIALAQSTA